MVEEILDHSPLKMKINGSAAQSLSLALASIRASHDEERTLEPFGDQSERNSSVFNRGEPVALQIPLPKEDDLPGVLFLTPLGNRGKPKRLGILWLSQPSLSQPTVDLVMHQASLKFEKPIFVTGEGNRPEIAGQPKEIEIEIPDLGQTLLKIEVTGEGGLRVTNLDRRGVIVGEHLATLTAVQNFSGVFSKPNISPKLLT